MSPEQEKKILGKFFTVNNPFEYDAFSKWKRDIVENGDEIVKILEPFAGANNIPNLLRDSKWLEAAIWHCFDISPPEQNNFPESPVIRLDTLRNFPSGYDVAITNPPYLARNSATRAGLAFPETEYDDLYKEALKVMLENCKYVAAIIPASFITQPALKGRLFSVVSLNCRMFDDTDCPVCLAHFTPKGALEGNYTVYCGEKILKRTELEALEPRAPEPLSWKFNDPSGAIGLQAIDNADCRSIRFCRGKDISGTKIKHSSRSITKIGTSFKKNSNLIKEANRLLNGWRDSTGDVMMTTFKGLRKDGVYRRRLDFARARSILDLAAHNVKEGGGK